MLDFQSCGFILLFFVSFYSNLLIVLIFIIFCFLFSFYLFKGQEKTSSFECGFVSLLDTRVSFSIQFFLFTLVFLIFDIEVSLLLPLPLLTFFSFYLYIGIILFLFVLIIGIYYEWFKGAFSWVI